MGCGKETDGRVCEAISGGQPRRKRGRVFRDEVEKIFGSRGSFDLQFVRVNARERFFRRLIGQTDPEIKRTIIGEEFPRVFGDEARKLKGKVRYLAQGTIYPDVVESGDGKTGDVIKSHHNVGGLPIEVVRELGFDETPIEPLRMLFKDEVRRVGLELGIPRELVYRQPFPGPGLGVRCPGAITRDRLEAVRESDAILREEFAKNGLEGKVWQYFTVVPDFKSTGVKDGKRTFDWPCIIRAINTTDVMEVTVEHLPAELIDHLVQRIITEVPGINRVLYDFTPKPPATVEYE